MTDQVKRVARVIDPVAWDESDSHFRFRPHRRKNSLRAAAAAIAATDQWELIEGVPTNKAPVLFWIPAFFGDEVCIGCAEKIEALPGAWVTVFKDKWDGEEYETETGTVEPTHWMPKPGPPS